MNLAVLRKTRKGPFAGDVFAMLPPDGRYLFGRVIRTNAILGAMGEVILMYVHTPRSERKEDVPDLRRDQLLLRPLFINWLPWRRGYCEVVRNMPLRDSERWPRHCFRAGNGACYDELGNLMTGPFEPIGSWSLNSFRTLDDKISDALGIPLAE